MGGTRVIGTKYNVRNSQWAKMLMLTANDIGQAFFPQFEAVHPMARWPLKRENFRILHEVMALLSWAMLRTKRTGNEADWPCSHTN